MQDQASATPAYDLGHYLRPIGRHRALLVTALIVGLVLGAAYTLTKGRTYTSSAAVLVNNAPSIPGQVTSVNPTSGRTNGAINLDTEAQIVKSSTVLNRAVTTLNNGSKVGALRGRIDIVVPPNSTILRIACTGSSPSSAQACARAVASAYLANRLESNKQTITTAQNGFNQQLAGVRAALLQDSKDIQNSAPVSFARNNAIARQDSDKTNRNAINNALNQLAVAITTPGTVISAAGPGVSSKIGLITGPIAGLIVGLIIGIALIFVRESRDKLVRNSDDLLRYGVPLIGTSEPARGRPRDAASERAARTRFEQRIASVVAGAFDDDGGVIYIAAVSPNQSPDRIARRLASTLASVGHSVELVRADDVTNGRAPQRAVKPPPHPATSPSPSLFESTDPPGGASLGWPGTAGGAADLAPPPTPPRSQPVDDSFATDPAPLSIPQLVADSRRHAQFVIIEGEPAATDAQAYILTGLSDAALLIVDPQVTTRADLDEVVDQISVTGSELLGAVMWHLTRKQRQAESPGEESTAASATSNGGRRRGSNDPATPSRAADAAR